MGEKVQQLFELFQSYRTVQPGHKMAPALRERERVRSAFAQVRGHAVFTKRLTIQTLLTCRREREMRE